MILNVLMLMATCYHATASQCNADFLTTADGTRIESTEQAYSHRIVAVSRDLKERLPFGTVIMVKSDNNLLNGAWEVHDVMNERYSNAVDFLFNPDMPSFKKELEIKVVSYPRKRRVWRR